MLATRAKLFVHNDDAVFFAFAKGFGIRPAGSRASRSFALLACFKGKFQVAAAVFSGVGPKNPVPELPPAQAVNQFAGRHAGHTPGAALGIK
jgi:hypothetical protein